MKSVSRLRVSWLRTGIMTALLLLSSAWALAPDPLVFTNVAGDSATQQKYWDELLKYKLWGKSSLTFAGGNVKLIEAAGYTGTMGDFTMQNTNHMVLGVVVVGGNIINGDGLDTFDLGYVRTGGNIVVSSNGSSSTRFFYQTCEQGNANNGNGVFSHPRLTGNADCPAGFPALETDLSIPSFSGSYGTDVWYQNNGTLIVDGRPDSGLTVKDIYLDEINFQNKVTLLIRQEPTAGITRIFVRKMNLSSTQWNIGVTYDGATMIPDSSYRGSLLIYTESDLKIGASSGNSVQGTYISKGAVSIQQGLSLAGQLIGESVSVNAGFNTADFRYVPFDPPVIDPTALASGVFYEAVSGNQPVNIRLDRDAVVDVTFKAYFLTPGGAVGVADASDLVAGTYPASVGEAVSVTIPKGSRVPLVPLTLQVYDDVISEPTESFYIVIFDLEGAVLPNNKFIDTLALSIIDNDQEQPPVARDTTYSIPENSPLGTLVGNALATDPNPNAVLTYAIIGGNIKAAFTIDGATGAITVLNAAAMDYEGFPNSWNLTILVTDNTAKTDTAVVRVLLTNVNEAPAAIALSYATDEDVPLDVTAADGLLKTAFDVDGDSLVAIQVTSVSHGALVVNHNGSFSYLPAENYYGTDSFTYKVRDPGGLESSVQTVTITIRPVNDVPVLNKPKAYEVNEDELLTVTAAAGLLDGAFDVEGEAMTAVLVATTSHGVLTLNLNGSFTYMPAENYNGPDSLTFRIRDASGGLSVVYKALITVMPVNDAPVATDKAYELYEDAMLTVNVANGLLKDAFDVDGDPLTALLVSPARHSAALTVNPNGSFTYRPALNYFGNDTLTYKVRDPGGLESSVQTVIITIHPVNDAPVGTNKSYNTLEDVALSVSVAEGLLVGVTDVEDNRPFKVLLAKRPLSGASLTLADDGSFVYTPVLNWFGRDQFQFRIQDSEGATSAEYIAFVQVESVNDAPVMSDTSFSVAENVPGGTLVGVLKAVDPDGDRLSFSLVSGEGFYVEATGEVRVLPSAALDYESQKVYTLTVAATDPSGASAEASVTIHVLDLPEYTDVVIVSAKSGDSTWKYPDTIWVNQTRVLVDWSSDGRLRSDWETVPENKKTLIVKRDIAPGKDIAGSDTLVVVMNNRKPEIVFELPPVRPDPIEGVTVVEPVDPLDSVIYVNGKDKNIPVKIIVQDKDLKPVVIDDVFTPELKEGLNTVTYTYVDIYGNTGTKTVQIYVDLTPPVVKIISPTDKFRTENVVQHVEWTVDGRTMNILNLQTLQKGYNQIIRTYRDRAGNEGSDTVGVFFIQGKDIDIVLEKELLRFDPELIEKFYSTNPPKENELYSISVLNNTTGLEEKTLYGKGANTVEADGSEPYPGMSGSHLGPTLRLRIRLPQMGGTNAMGEPRSGTFADLVDANGMVLIQAGNSSGGGSGTGGGVIDGGDGSQGQVAIPVAEYVENYCLDGYFDGLTPEQALTRPMYDSRISLQVHIFDVNGQFVDRMNVQQPIGSSEFLDDDGVLTMFFELKPSQNLGLVDVTGRQYGTGAYIINASVKAVSKRICDMPVGKRGENLRTDASVLDKFGYQRPNK